MVGVPGGIKESTMSLYEDPLSTPTIVFECQPAREPLHFRLPYLFSPSSILDHAAFLLRFRISSCKRQARYQACRFGRRLLLRLDE